MTAIEDNVGADLYRQQTQFVKELAIMAKKFNVLIFLIVHPKKNNEAGADCDAVMGSSNITNLADVVLNYSEPKKDQHGDRVLHIWKNRLNGIYGMFATDICRLDVSYNYATMEWSEVKDPGEDVIEEKINKFYKSRNSFTYYAHGVWTTAWARDCLLDIVKNVVGYENYLYCDTDSVFYKESPEIESRIASYNNEVIALNKKLGLGVLNRDNEISYYGILAHEEHCKTFKFLHSKCYGFTDDDDKLHITIAGVTKDNRLPKNSPEYVTREQELGSLDNLEDGFIFEKCGGTRSVYVSYAPTQTIINGHTLQYAGACIIMNTTKELGGTVDGYEIMEVI